MNLIGEVKMEDKLERGVRCYKSTMLNKVFDTYQELVEAEELYERENAEKIKAAETKKIRAEEVQEAYKQCILARKKANELIAEADNRYYELRNNFIKDYKYFHVSYSDCDDGLTVIKSLFDIFN